MERNAPAWKMDSVDLGYTEIGGPPWVPAR